MPAHFNPRLTILSSNQSTTAMNQWLRGHLIGMWQYSVRWTTVITASRKHTGTLRKRIHFVLCKHVLATYITWNILILTKHTCHCCYFAHHPNTHTHTQKHLHFLFTFHPLVHQERTRHHLFFAITPTRFVTRPQNRPPMNIQPTKRNITVMK